MAEELSARARALAAEVLKDDVRHDGSPFISHPDGVASVVRDEIGLPDECVTAVYLHEALRMHPDVSVEDFPQDVMTMVEGLNKIATIKPKDTRLEAENYKKLIVSYSSDPRVTVIKLADRLEVMRRLEMFPKSSRDQKLLETTMLYMPIAHQLGLYNINTEFGDICFRYNEPEQYRAITNKLKATEKDRERLSAEFVEPLKQKLSDAGIKYKLKVRTKSAYSIFRKMQAQKVPFEGVYDVFAIRFIIDCEPDRTLEHDLCWKVYSYVTDEYEPDLKRLRDWVTNPKPNGYESLQITVKNRDGASLEVQIRTVRMDYQAENGNASHWSYKGVKGESTTARWLQSVREAMEHPFDAKKEDLPAPPEKEIFIFTPTGELKILPTGSSVLDFAFCIHSNVGCRCVGGRINGRAVQIKEKLKTGDTVEIVTGKNQKPSRDWLSWVVTSKARGKIRQELDAEERKKASEGREILARRLKNWKLEFPDDQMRDFMQKNRYTTNIAFWAAIYDEELDVNDIKAYILKRAEVAVPAASHDEAPVVKGISYASGGDDILVLNAKNVKGLDYKMSACCNPVFGDDVFGFVTRTSGIKIHRISCPNAARLMDRYPYRIQKVVWQETGSGGDFQATLKIAAELEHTVLADIMTVISQFKASLRSFDVRENSHDSSYEITVRVLVPSNLELDKVVSQVGNLRNVIKVKRV